MTSPTRSNSLQSYQIVLYNRALHPEFFPLKGRRVDRHGGYELESWVMQGCHLLRFEYRTLCCTELLTDQDGNLPATGVVTAFLAAGERDFEHRFEKDKVTYLTTVQTETLSDSLYAATYKEMLDHARDTRALLHQWEDESGRCLSLIDIQKHLREVHAQAFHLVAAGGIVIRTQSIFETA